MQYYNGVYKGSLCSTIMGFIRAVYAVLYYNALGECHDSFINAFRELDVSTAKKAVCCLFLITKPNVPKR